MVAKNVEFGEFLHKICHNLEEIQLRILHQTESFDLVQI